MNYNDTRHDSRLHLIGYAAIAVFGALLVFMAHAYNQQVQHEIQANASADKWAYQAAIGNESIEQLVMQRDMLQEQLDELAALTLDLVSGPLVGAKPCVEPDPTPVFSRDSQLIH